MGEDGKVNLTESNFRNKTAIANRGKPLHETMYDDEINRDEAYNSDIKREYLFRGSIWMVNLTEGTVGSEQGGIRPCVVIQNDVGNAFSDTTIIVPLTTKIKPKLPTHVNIAKTDYNTLKASSILLCEQIRLIDSRRLIRYLGHITKDEMKSMNKALSVSIF